MRIVILAWGSLLWQPGNPQLQLATDWQAGGPSVPLEFSRISRSRAGALTLVIDPRHGVTIPTSFALSAHQELEKAIVNLATREGTNAETIGFLLRQSTVLPDNIPVETARNMYLWGQENGFDAVIWTALSSNFAQVDQRIFADVESPTMPFNLDNAQRYLHKLKTEGAIQAREYLKKAPQAVQTPLRKHLEKDPWLEIE